MSMKFSVRVSFPESGKYDWFEAVKKYKDILNVLKENINIIKIFHISNRIKNSIKQHYPIYYSEEEIALDFNKIFTFLKRKGFAGHLVLEYLPQFHPQLLPDAINLINTYEHV